MGISKLNFIKICLLTTFISATAHGVEFPVLLKKKEPNWRPATQNKYENGIPKTILFYEPEKGGHAEIPVKLVENYPEGKIHVETDLKFQDGILIPDGASATYTDEGVLHIYASYKNGNLDGNIFIFNPNGQLKTSYKVQKGILEGVKESFHENGQIAEKAHYTSGQLHGTVERFYDNGAKAALIHYQYGILEGEVIEWNPDESIKEKLFYIAGVQFNSQKLPLFTPGLSPLAKMNEEFQDVSPMLNLDQNFHVPEILSGEVVVNHPDGTIAKKLYYREGKPHDEQISYYPNGKQEALLTYCDGVLNGKKSLYDNIGVLLEEAFYKNGDLEGRYYVRRPNGQEVISHYHNNRLYGLYQVFHPTNPTFGKVKAFEAYYENGLVEGEASEFNEAGTKITSTLYKNGKKQGLATIYYKDGKVRITANFNLDRQEGMTYEYYPSGNLAKEAHFLDGFRDGEEKTYHDNGQIKTFYTIKKDKLHGSGKEWNSQGTLIFEANYNHGKKEGLFKKYDEAGLVLSKKLYENDQLVEKQL